MLVSIYCKDAPGSVAPRQEKLAEHIKHVESIEDKIMVAGPIMGDDGEQAVASLLVVEVGGLDEATEMMHADPYFEAGVWQEVNIHEYKAVVGSWVGGKAW